MVVWSTWCFGAGELGAWQIRSISIICTTSRWELLFKHLCRGLGMDIIPSLAWGKQRKKSSSFSISLSSSSVNGSYILPASAMASARRIPSRGSVDVSNRERDLFWTIGTGRGRYLGLLEWVLWQPFWRLRVIDGIGFLWWETSPDLVSLMRR